ncbi:HlyD family secretion protein, partial [Rhizobium ruizarguesonis]
IDDEALSGLLRSGMSVEPEIDTKADQTKAVQTSGAAKEGSSNPAG